MNERENNYDENGQGHDHEGGHDSGDQTPGQDQFQTGPSQEPQSNVEGEGGGSTNVVAVIAVVVLLALLAYAAYVFMNRNATPERPGQGSDTENGVNTELEGEAELPPTGAEE
ncbi:MAG: hypothetical protein U5L75_02715 [Candidatus Campbellbacteria bacterium]|nr:hypothetical protein [Candidatus Campbellbacteria bacterium]